jgi:hypothetical protein
MKKPARAGLILTGAQRIGLIYVPENNKAGEAGLIIPSRVVSWCPGEDSNLHDVTR